MQVDSGVSLKPYNTFGLPAVARTLVRVRSDDDVRRVVADPVLGPAAKFVLGGGSNIILTRDMPQVVLKVEVPGMAVVEERADAWIVEAGGGVGWDDLVAFTLEAGCPGLENMASIPGTVGASPVQNIGAYGIELKDRFESLDAVDLATGETRTWDAARCRFGYRDSAFKRGASFEPVDDTPPAAAPAPGSASTPPGSQVITRVRFRLPRPWQPVLGYLELQRKMLETGVTNPTPRQIHDWIVAIRRTKLPDPAAIGNAGSFFKNPVVTPEQCRDIIGRDPEIVHYPLPDGSVKLAAGWMIDVCGWKGKSVGGAGVYEKQALVLVNRGAAIGSEVMTLARAIQESVYGRFGIRLEPEPVIV
ncbi:UDP-N-acetylmuramate dehydrogenase [Piscinibacter koreensis]|uniref:UDP-N-acetylenolpyruvoylglucosamine reductase n=1 Tax=Piscinibacter koreensis TaxID=2742824 RepID=A0A7Y6NQ18_9BURK|nr:UDP-N-acetylmuramate dehydrogenase [Schlegelella koreensis]NUZ07181.1 UDP-N-acetylmuramate dehydrogenase [Schlegelella koreensis]